MQHNQFLGLCFTLTLQKPPHTHEHVFLIRKFSKKDHLPTKDTFFPVPEGVLQTGFSIQQKMSRAKSWKDIFHLMKGYSVIHYICNKARREDISKLFFLLKISWINNFMGKNSNKILALCFGALVYFGLSNQFLREKCLNVFKQGNKSSLCLSIFNWKLSETLLSSAQLKKIKINAVVSRAL